MQALQRLQDKIEELKLSFDILKEENDELRLKVSNIAPLEEEIVLLRGELAQKDTEIEAIIAKIEALLE
jgi:predicted RNase H-like nuclease (RuvC/YqgF family)